MSNQEFINSLTKEQMFRVLSVEGATFNLSLFLFINMLQTNVEHISQIDAQRVIDLDVGVSTFIETIEIKRIK